MVDTFWYLHWSLGPPGVVHLFLFVVVVVVVVVAVVVGLWKNPVTENWSRNWKTQ